MTGPMPGSITELKTALRRTAMALRRAAHTENGTAAARTLCQRLSADITLKDKTIAGYWPLGDELDCRPALEGVIAQGGKVALPVVAGQGQVLLFRGWQPGDPLDPGPFGTAHPTVRSAVVTPDVLLLPLLAFDNTGHRLGYGAGYYDRTVDALRRQRSIIVIGVAYDAQEVGAVPRDPHDQQMDAVMTDRRTLWFNAAAKS
jgi:5-formyltetrahydrofolate cyclo-ligase